MERHVIVPGTAAAPWCFAVEEMSLKRFAVEQRSSKAMTYGFKDVRRRYP
jgi:hypothetical protein